MRVKLDRGVVIAVGNQKGGCAKTTTAVHLAAAMGEKGYTTLVIDCDPHSGATKHFGIEPEAFGGTLELVVNDEDPRELALAKDLKEGIDLPKNVDLIPSRTELEKLDELIIVRSHKKFQDRLRILEHPLNLCREHWDIVIVDTPPSSGAILTLSALSCSDYVILTTIAEHLSLQGLRQAFADIAAVRNDRNPNLEVLGVLLSRIDRRTTDYDELQELLDERAPGRRFATVISAQIALPRVSKQGKTLFQVPAFAKSHGIRQFRIVADQVEERILHRAEFLAGTLVSKHANEEPELRSSPATDVVPQLPARGAARLAGNE